MTALCGKTPHFECRRFARPGGGALIPGLRSYSYGVRPLVERR